MCEIRKKSEGAGRKRLALGQGLDKKHRKPLPTGAAVGICDTLQFPRLWGKKEEDYDETRVYKRGGGDDHTGGRAPQGSGKKRRGRVGEGRKRRRVAVKVGERSGHKRAGPCDKRGENGKGSSAEEKK